MTVLPPVPFPPLPPIKNIWDKIVRFGKKVLGLIFRKEIEELGSQNPVTKNSSADEISNITQIFAEYRKKIEGHAKELETQLCEEIADFAEDLRFEADTQNPIFSKYPARFHRFERMISKCTGRMEGTIIDTVSKKVSLDSPECFEIMRMFPGEKKEERVKVLFQTALRDGLQQAVNKFDEICSELLEEYEDAIAEAIGQAALNASNMSEQMSVLIAGANKDENVAAMVVAKANSAIQAALVVNELLCLEVE